MRHNIARIGVPIVVGILLLAVPLVGDFHIESAVLASLAGCLWAGISACNHSSSSSDFWDALRITGYLLLVGVQDVSVLTDSLSGSYFPSPASFLVIR